MIVCSIDLMNGKAVQLKQGKEIVLERDDIFALAERFGRLGDVAVIDLDAAFGNGDNTPLVEELCRRTRCRVGGGIRTVERAQHFLRAGAQSVIIGTAATPEFLTKLPRERAIVAIDSRDDRVSTHGWREVTGESPLQRASRLQPYCGGFLSTDIDRDGTLAGANLDAARRLRGAVSGTLTVAGGITSADEVAALDRAGIDAQVGVAVYTGRLDPVDAVLQIADFDKGNGLLPTIVCDAYDGRVRMFAYCSRESLAATLRTGQATYWSRSRRERWRKGETSGCTQAVRRVELDCDRDAIVFYVEQTGVTCHLHTERCFGSASFSWADLMRRIDERAANSNARSLTRRLLDDAPFLHEKVLEEAGEVTRASERAEVAWECADLLYFMSVKMRAAGVTLDDVMAQLAARATR
jgi:phosphoribosyl-AMP cyclohydrolase / phosphoribosyl-ATP pyrophosphohydrolase